jgi:hypothetical protein
VVSGRNSMAACYRLGESKLTVGTGATWNGGVATPFYRAGEGEERAKWRRSSGGRQWFDDLRWGNSFAP